MSDGTSIEWAQHPLTGKGASWNPVLARLPNGKLGYHCEHVSDGCSECYAETFNLRNLPNRGTGLPFKPGHRKDIEIVLDDKMLQLPLKWRDPRGIFVCSMSDLFGSFVPDAMIDQMLAVMALCPQHIFMVLTKRPERARAYLSDSATVRRVYEAACDIALTLGVAVVLVAPGVAPSQAPAGQRVFLDRWPLPNVWLGTSAEDQGTAAERLQHVLQAPAAKRFVSFEPLLGPIDPTDLCNGRWFYDALRGERWHDGPGTNPVDKFAPGLDWAIIGGMSGRRPREYRYSWARSLIRQCKEAGTAAFHKQVGANPVDDLGYVEISHAVKLKDLKGGDMLEWPEELRVRQFPSVEAA